MQIRIAVALLALTLIVGFALAATNVGAPVSATTQTVARKATRTPKPENSVTLDTPNNQDVQMFEKVGIGDEGVTTMFPDGTPCTQLGESTPVDFGDGMVLNFYKLSCSGTIGYVNAKWVDD